MPSSPISVIALKTSKMCLCELLYGGLCGGSVSTTWKAHFWVKVRWFMEHTLINLSISRRNVTQASEQVPRLCRHDKGDKICFMLLSACFFVSCNAWNQISCQDREVKPLTILHRTANLLQIETQGEFAKRDNDLNTRRGERFAEVVGNMTLLVFMMRARHMARVIASTRFM